MPGADLLQWDVALAGLGIVKYRVALGKRAASAVLPGQAHWRLFHEQRADGQRFSERPIVGAAVLEGLDAARDKAFGEGGVDVESVWQRGQGPSELLELLTADATGHRRVGVRRLDDGRGSTEGRALAASAEFHHFVIAGFQLVPNRLLDGINLLLAERFAGHELLLVNLAKRLTGSNFSSHQRLCEGCLVRLVVALAAIAQHVDDHIAAKLLTEFEGQA